MIYLVHSEYYIILYYVKPTKDASLINFLKDFAKFPSDVYRLWKLFNSHILQEVKTEVLKYIFQLVNIIVQYTQHEKSIETGCPLKKAPKK